VRTRAVAEERIENASEVKQGAVDVNATWVGFVSPDLKGRHLTDWPRRRTTHRFMTIGPMTRTRTLTSLNVW
jgi:hypothetical protein